MNRTLVADLDLERPALAVLGDPAVADGDDLALLRLVLRGVGQHDPAGRRRLGLFPLDHHAIAQRLELHGWVPLAFQREPRPVTNADDPTLAISIGVHQARFDDAGFGCKPRASRKDRPQPYVLL